MIREIVVDEEILGNRADEVDIKKDGKRIRDTVVILKDAVRELGITDLSAPQIGENIRVFVIKFGDKIRSFVNPIITGCKGLELSREICTSMPGRTFIRPRNNNINVTYMTPLGKIESCNLVGKAAIVFQHCLDHLDGILLSDIGLEVGEEYDNATEEERQELLSMYVDSLDLKMKDVKAEIDNDEELKQISDAAEFITKVQSGEVKLENV